MAGLALLGEVELRDPQLRASAAEARYAPGAREVELRGDRVVVVGARGELVAPRVVWDLAASVARASGGVQATLADEGGGAFAGTPLAGGEGPVRIEASEAEWREAEQTFRFHGAARAWRGEAVLIAQEISGDQRAASLAASGAVKTVWPQRSEPAAGEAGAVPPPPVQVTAERLDYARAERRLRYSGTVVVRRTELTMACAEADVELDEQERARRMTCTGGVRLDDAAAARQVTGERAEYDLATETLTVTGTPVVLVDSARGRAEGQKLVYDLGGRTVRLFATPAESGG
jgi:lipopolysaccharide transport protein LptA